MGWVLVGGGGGSSSPAIAGAAGSSAMSVAAIAPRLRVRLNIWTPWGLASRSAKPERTLAGRGQISGRVHSADGHLVAAVRQLLVQLVAPVRGPPGSEEDRLLAAARTAQAVRTGEETATLA